MTALILIAVFGVSVAVTAGVRGYALHRQLLDMPDHRSSHDVPTPRGGGLGIVVAVTAATIWSAYTGRVDGDLALALCGPLAIAAIGFVDDHGHVPAWTRLLVHAAAGIWVLAWLGGAPAIPLMGQLLYLPIVNETLALVAFVWLVNLYNFMDGIDGIAGAQAVFVGVGLALVGTPPIMVVALCLAAAATGFLVWNWPPARIFMGDIGSGYIGGIIGVLAIAAIARIETSPAVPLLLMGIFAVDATTTLLRRAARKGVSWHQPHRSHAYQKATRLTGGHRPVTLAVAAINGCWLLPMALAAWFWPERDVAFLLLGLMPILVVVVRLGAGGAEPDALDPDRSKG